jgi:hypothetical protein
MAQLTTTIKYNLLDSSKALLQKAVVDYGNYSKEPSSVYAAMDCAFSCWHLVDWVWNEYESHRKIAELRQEFFAACPYLRVMHDIANGSKHAQIERPKSEMTNATIEQSYVAEGYVAEGYIAKEVTIYFTDGSSQAMSTLLHNVIEFWQTYFSEKP